MENENFSTMEMDAIGEILNISLGASATAISNMLNARVDITTPSVSVISQTEFEMNRVEPAIGVEINYTDGLEGCNVILLKKHDVKVIVGMLMGETGEDDDEDFELNEINISAICELMNQMMGASATALSEFLGCAINISTPVSFEVENKEQFIEKYFVDGQKKVLVSINLSVGDQLESEFFHVMPIALAKSLLKGFLPKGAEEEGETKVEEKVREVPVSMEQPREETAQPHDAELMKQLCAMQEKLFSMEKQLEDAEKAKQQSRAPRQIQASPIIQPGIGKDAGHETAQEQEENMELILGVPLEISVEIGRSKKMVRDILELTKGSLVVLDKLAGEPADLYVNGQCIARGDVVVVEENFGIRITEILKLNFNSIR